MINLLRRKKRRGSKYQTKIENFIRGDRGVFDAHLNIPYPLVGGIRADEKKRSAEER